MEKQSDIKFQQILETVRNHFDFLFQRGYRITSAMFTDINNENWNVMIASENCLIKIHYRDEKLHLSLCSLHLLGKTGLFDLHELVHWMSQDGDLPQRIKSPPDETEQLVTTAGLLEEHIDDILILFQKIHLGIANSIAGELFKDSSPAFSMQEKSISRLIYHQPGDFVFTCFVYSFTSPSITSPSFERGGVEGPPGASG